MAAERMERFGEVDTCLVSTSIKTKFTHIPLFPVCYIVSQDGKGSCPSAQGQGAS